MPAVAVCTECVHRKAITGGLSVSQGLADSLLGYTLAQNRSPKLKQSPHGRGTAAYHIAAVTDSLTVVVAVR
jgi:hypothetical protein